MAHTGRYASAYCRAKTHHYAEDVPPGQGCSSPERIHIKAASISCFSPEIRRFRGILRFCILSCVSRYSLFAKLKCKRCHFFREALIKSARAGSEGFCSQAKDEKWRNTECISHFSSCGMGTKGPLSGRRRFVQRFLRKSFSPFLLSACIEVKKQKGDMHCYG